MRTSWIMISTLVVHTNSVLQMSSVHKWPWLEYLQCQENIVQAFLPFSSLLAEVCRQRTAASRTPSANWAERGWRRPRYCYSLFPPAETVPSRPPSPPSPTTRLQHSKFTCAIHNPQSTQSIEFQSILRSYGYITLPRSTDVVQVQISPYLGPGGRLEEGEALLLVGVPLQF